MRRSLLLAALAAALFLLPLSAPAATGLSAKGAFTLLRTVAPGDTLESAAGFLGAHASERTVDEKEKLRIRRWGKPGEAWFFEALHDGAQVRATRIIWATASKREQQVIFSQLTSEGKKFFGKSAKFNGLQEASWTDAGDKLLVRARLNPGAEEGVTLLTGIRDAKMGSEKYGF